MEMTATITGYLIIVALCIFIITTGIYWTVHRIIDAFGVRDEFLKMKRQRNTVQKIIRKLLRANDDHMTACDRTMGSTHPCTCDADEARRLLDPVNDNKQDQ